MRVAFLGLGRMGVPMAGHLVRAGHDVTAWNRTPKPGAVPGARHAATVEEAVRDADVVVTMLFGPDAVREVLARVPEESFVVDCSTVGPDVAREVGARFARFVDAPVAGSVGPATDGTLGVLVGGSAEDYAAALPLLRLWGDPDRIWHLGPVGAGNAMKLVINLTLGVAMGGVGEALRLADGLGCDRAATLDVLAIGPLGFSVKTKRSMLESGTFRPTGFSLDLMTKDLGLALDAAPERLALTADAYDAARAAIGNGHGDDDYASLAGHLGGIA